MKKILIASNVLMLSIIILMGCHRQNEKESTAKQEIPLSKCGICDTYPNDSLDGVISGDIVRRLSYAYFKDGGKAYINGTKDADALSLVFDLEKVKKFIWLMEKYTCKAGCPKPLGIRFYYIKYDLSALGTISEKEKKLFEKNANKHSLAMVPVYKDDDDEWYDFDAKNVQTCCDFMPKLLMVSKGTALVSVDADNHGGVGPPPHPGYYPSLPRPYGPATPPDEPSH